MTDPHGIHATRESARQIRELIAAYAADDEDRAVELLGELLQTGQDAVALAATLAKAAAAPMRLAASLFEARVILNPIGGWPTHTTPGLVGAQMITMAADGDDHSCNTLALETVQQRDQDFVLELIGSLLDRCAQVYRPAPKGADDV